MNSLEVPLVADPSNAEEDALTALQGSREDRAGHLRAIFVAHFHTTTGCVMEWQHPPDVDLGGVELKAFAPGLHRSVEDGVFFRHEGRTCAARFHRLDVDSDEERHARMRVVGMVGDGLVPLWGHEGALGELAAAVNRDVGHFAPLERFYNGALASAPPGAPAVDGARAEAVLRLASDLGPRIFVVWKAVLLRRRVLLHDPGPVRPLCDATLAAWALGCCDAAAEETHPLAPGPNLLHVFVGDLRALVEARGGFVACTSDSIFAERPAAWDLFCPRGEAVLVNDASPGAADLHQTAADGARWRRLRRVIGAALDPGAGEAERRRGASRCLRFFLDMNTEICRRRAAGHAGAPPASADVRERDLRAMGIHRGDELFLAALTAANGMVLNVRRRRCTSNCCC